jgi:NADH:ubiquinone oxidoreductase subunit F (NADH-binding)
VIDRIIANRDRATNTALLEDLCNTMKFGSLCALGVEAMYHLPLLPGTNPDISQSDL